MNNYWEDKNFRKELIKFLEEDMYISMQFGSRVSVHLIIATVLEVLDRHALRIKTDKDNFKKFIKQWERK